MLLDEDVRVELRHPEPALRGPLEIGQRRADIGLNPLPEEAGILLGEVGRVLATELVGQPDLAQLVVERRELAQIGWVGQLANQIGGPHQRRPRCRSRCGRRSSGTGNRVSSIARQIRSTSRNGMPAQRWRTKILPRSTCQGARKASVEPRGAVTVVPAASIT